MTSRFPDLRIDGDRLLRRIDDLAAIGPIDGGGSCRLALTDDDRAGRDLVVTWMRDLGLDPIWDDKPHMQRWWAAMQDRPAYRATYYPGTRVTDIYDDIGVPA